MNFIEFLELATQENFWLNNFVFCFKGKQYPILFFNNLFQVLYKQKFINEKPRFLQISSLDLSDIFHSLSTSFLGSAYFYNLGEVGLKSDKKTKEILNFIKSYEGPNKISLFLNEDITLESKNTFPVINLDEEINNKSFVLLAKFLKRDQLLHKSNLIKKMFDNIKTLSLDNCCIMFEYLDLANSNNIKDFEKLISILFESKEPLHNLSKTFFSKSGAECFKCWIKIKDDYPPIFWVMYWSEQLWQGFNVINFLEKGKLIEAKKIGYRLPFNFFNQLWKLCNKQELINAHSFIYLADFKLKRGSILEFFELFLSKYFSGEFMKNNKSYNKDFPAANIKKLSPFNL